MLGVRPVASPMADKNELYGDARGVTTAEHKWARSVNGSIAQFSKETRWGIAMETNRIAQTMESPTQGTLSALRRVMAYMAGTLDHCLMVPVTNANVWTSYVDSDHAGDRATGTKSRSGIIFCLNGMPAHWRSSKQPITAVSSTEAEIYALSEAAKDVRHRYWVAEDMGDKQEWPALINVDNAAAIIFQRKVNVDGKLKGMIDLRQNWVKELKDTKVLQAVKVDTKYNLADALTKCMTGTDKRRMQQIVKDLAEDISKKYNNK